MKMLPKLSELVACTVKRTRRSESRGVCFDGGTRQLESDLLSIQT